MTSSSMPGFLGWKLTDTLSSMSLSSRDKNWSIKKNCTDKSNFGWIEPLTQVNTG